MRPDKCIHYQRSNQRWDFQELWSLLLMVCGDISGKSASALAWSNRGTRSWASALPSLVMLLLPGSIMGLLDRCRFRKEEE